MTRPDYQSGEGFTTAMDARDPVAHFRSRFLIPKARTGEDCIYLCGHSLGLQPKKVSSYLEEELADWATRINDSGAKRAWVYFNNDFDAYAPKNAVGLRRMLRRAQGFR